MSPAAPSKEGWGSPDLWSDDQAQTIESEFIKFEKEHDTLIGVLIEKGEQEMRNGTVGRYVVEGEDEKLRTFHGTTDLDDKLSLVNVGDLIRIEYLGNQNTGSGQSMKTFKVQSRPQVSAPVNQST